MTSERAVSVIDTLPPFITKVGVFVDSDLATVRNTVEACGLNQVQLHGKETPSFCLDLKKWRRELSICKAFRVGAESPPVDVSSYSPVIDSVLLDTYVKGNEGGTGVSFDWSLIDSLKLDRPLILAGGLTPDNIIDAVSSVRPYAVDINSGVEKSPGVKDHSALQELIGKIRKFECGLL